MIVMVEGKKGTTTLGIVCKDGIVLASDKNASLGHLSYDTVDKVFKITNQIAITTAGNVSDAQILVKFLQTKMERYQIDRDHEPTVDVAASFLANILYSGSKQFFPYMTMFILGGMGEDGWKMFSLDPSGSSIANRFVATGSGMELALGVLEENFKPDMSIDAGKSLALKAMTSALRRDIFTGIGIDICVIDKTGFKKVDHKNAAEVLRKD